MPRNETCYHESGGMLSRRSGMLVRKYGWLVFGFLALTISSACSTGAEKGSAPAEGSVAPDFELATLSGEKIRLTQLLKQGPVVLAVLRGYPGYQCPACNTQTKQLLGSAKKFASAKATVVLVYPGAARDLSRHAGEFARGKTLPDNFHLALDPDFELTLAYRLRWDAANETAYPATFLIDSDGKVRFSKVSTTHGGRAAADEVLAALGKLSK
ncbi:MAG: peroxiredoxin family protein [Pirellulaceae bacterium]|nr:peroxiredoxin family protein [Pirellulaceae bacterium]